MTAPAASVTQPMIDELRTEANATRRMLDRVPADRLDWRPHPRSMSLGQLAMHIAQIPGALSNLLAAEGFDAVNANFSPASPQDREEVFAALDAALERAEEFISGLDERALAHPWAMTNRGAPVFTIARVELVRALVFNHWYHHRGQLSVYLRLLDIPVPVMYGRSADENPFA